MNPILQLIIGIVLGILVAALAWKVGALSASGAAAAAVTGGLIFGLGGIPWAVLLLAFFLSSSILSRLFGRQKRSLAEKFSKGSRRDWGQVLANGGVGTILVIVHLLLPGLSLPWLAFAGTMAAVNADTWATELGVLNPRPPRLITTWQEVERGTSGGISWLGTAAAVGGALFIAICAAFFTPLQYLPVLLLVVVFAGLLGSLFDSFLGATVQAIYFCPACQKETERYPLHLCGTPTEFLKGWSWLNNDWVNTACALVGAIVAGGLWLLVYGAIS